MAYGRPGKGAAFLYLGFALGGLVVFLCAEPAWARILGIIALSYSLFSLLITGAFLELLPAAPAAQRALGPEPSKATGNTLAPREREVSAGSLPSERAPPIEAPSEFTQQPLEPAHGGTLRQTSFIDVIRAVLDECFPNECDFAGSSNLEEILRGTTQVVRAQYGSSMDLTHALTALMAAAAFLDSAITIYEFLRDPDLPHLPR